MARFMTLYDLPKALGKWFCSVESVIYLAVVSSLCDMAGRYLSVSNERRGVGGFERDEEIEGGPWGSWEAISY
jgi:hypothetical protein